MQILHSLIQNLHLNDILYSLGYSFLALYIFFKWLQKQNEIQEKQTKLLLLLALFVKIVAGFCFGFLYFGYYKQGDTINFWLAALELKKLIHTDPAVGFRILFDIPEAKEHFLFRYIDGRDLQPYFTQTPKLMFVRVIYFCSYFCGNSWYGTSVWFSVFAFTGLFQIFRLAKNVVPPVFALFVLFFVPTATLLSAGIIKESLIMGALGWGIYSVYTSLTKQSFSKNIVVFWGIIGIFKSYLLIAILPFLSIWFAYFEFKKKNKWAFFLIILITIILGSGVLVGTKYSFEYVRMYTFHLRQYTLDKIVIEQKVANSYIDIGSIEPTWKGIIKLAPIGFATTYFRPVWWEAKSGFERLLFIENLALVTIFVFFVVKVLHPKHDVEPSNNNSIYYLFIVFLVFSVVYSIFLGISVPFYGSLVRYRVVVLPFFFIGLLVLIKNQKANLFGIRWLFNYFCSKN